MKRILVQNNFHCLSAYAPSDVRILFAPKYFCQIQKSFFERRFQEIKAHYPDATWVTEVSPEDFDIALSWDASYEKKAFGERLSGKQNRLFDELPFNLPESFTPFRQLAEKYLPPHFPEAVVPSDREVLAELDYYFRFKKLPSTYLETRNELTGRDGSTKFSAFLSCGALDVKHLYNEVKQFEGKHGASKSSGWIIFELLWREFFYWHYQKYPRSYFSEKGLRGLKFSPVPELTLLELSEMKAHPFFHAALRELTSTGFLSNRARQIFASIWINDLNLDWRSGAALFETYLIDYDVYSNYGNWMYLAGVGVDPRGKRYFNVGKQLEQYDPEGRYLETWKA